MALHLSWYNAEQTAFYVRYESGWTWEQHHAMIQQIADWRTSQGLTSSLCLFDLRGTTVPFDSPAREHYQDPREGSFIVIVLNNMFTRTIAELAIRARGHQHMIHLVPTLEDGKALLDAQLLHLRSFSRSQPGSHS